jgi:conjugative relaxase-like TrwC/TraI family protein
MLSITKINSQAKQGRKGGAGYAHYLGEPSTRQRGDFDDYARPKDDGAPPPFWACKGAALLGLDAIAEAEQVERLARAFHPVTGAALVKGAGREHVMGLDMTFSAPKDVSAVFAGADAATRAAIVEAIQGAARAALDYAEAATLTRHGKAGLVKQRAEAALAACYTHFASRALDPQLHVHAFMFNVGKRQGVDEWSALEHRSQFERKLATGALFRAELARRMRDLGFGIVASGPYFAIAGVTDAQREALSTRSREIAEHMQRAAFDAGDGAAAREVAALNTRRAKSEPPLPELLARFEEQAAALGITPSAVAAMRQAPAQVAAPLAIEHGEILAELMESQSCATAQEALCLICERAVGLLSARECLAELARFLAHPEVVRLGATELLSEVFTSRATKELEARVEARVRERSADTSQRVARDLVHAEFDRMEVQLAVKLRVPVSLAQQREAALRVACDTGAHAFVEGWAGTGKTTMLRALGSAYRAAGFEVSGCCQSAAASLNLSRETAIPSRTIASLLLALRDGRAKLGRKSIVVLDEAGMVGSSEFAQLQEEVLSAGGKLVCVGDPKQLQPIGAGGIFASLMRAHGRAEISKIQRQRTDFEPLLDWLEQRARRPDAGISPGQARALREVPEESRLSAMERVCAADPKLARAFSRWRARFDYEWMREVVERFAKGEAADALRALDAKGRLRFSSGLDRAMSDLVAAWEADRTAVESKAIVAGTRAEVRELNRLARERLVARGSVEDHLGRELEVVDREENRESKRFAPGDRLVFTQNDRELGVVNGAVGTLSAFAGHGSDLRLVVELDEPGERGERRVDIPAAFGRFDLAYCLTNHKAQGRTFDAAYVLANPAMADREWTYVAASRSRFATTMFVNASALGLVDPESHAGSEARKGRADAVEALAKRMARSRAKGTTLDYESEEQQEPEALALTREAASRLIERIRTRSFGRALAR